MKRLKIMTVVGTRPEIIRLSRVIAVLDRECEHILVHTGQNYDYELNQIFFDDLGIRQPDSFLGAAGGTASATVGKIISSMDGVLDRFGPDALLVLGDTNSCLAAYSAKRRKIPIFHMEAGNRCFDERVPEEINRRIIDHLADINLPYSDISREYLLREGLPPDRIIKTGSPLFEVIQHYLPKARSSDVLARMAIAPNDYFLVSSHREENIDSAARFLGLIRILNGLAEEQGCRVIVTTHPRTSKKIETEAPDLSPRVFLAKPFSFSDYLKLQLEARAVLSDSGTLTEESNILNFPALNIREAHERPEGMEEGAVMLVGMDYGNVQRGLAVLDSQPRGQDRLMRTVSDYQAPNVSEKVLRIILSYTDYVNRSVWHKQSN
jgi:UDP-N-acetylglucosamine 2-epimerase